MNALFLTLVYFYTLIFIGALIGLILKKYNSEIRKILSFIFLYILTPPIIIFAFILPNFNVSFMIVLYIIIFQIILSFSAQIVIYLIAVRNKSKDVVSSIVFTTYEISSVALVIETIIL